MTETQLIRWLAVTGKTVCELIEYVTILIPDGHLNNEEIIARLESIKYIITDTQKALTPNKD